MKKEYIVKERKTIQYNRKEKGELDWSHLRRDCLIKHVTEGKMEGNIRVT
jgi:hypothetical protein